MRAVPGVEEVVDGTYRRSLRLAHGAAVVALTPGPDAVACSLHARVARRRAGRGAALPAAARPGQRPASDRRAARCGSAARRPRRQAPRPALARSSRRRRAARAGDDRPAGVGRRGAHARRPPRRRDRRAAADARRLGHPPVPDRRGARRPRARADEHADGAGPGDRRRVRAARRRGDRARRRQPTAPRSSPSSSRCDGIGPWTASYVAMRALGDPDVFMPTDLGVRHALDALGVDGRPGPAARLAERWSPWRSYALHHLWASLAPNDTKGSR